MQAICSATAISAGGTFSLALAPDGTVWAWGFNSSGQLGDGSNSTAIVPVQTSTGTGLTRAIAIAGGSAHSLAIRSDGTVWAWGLNTSGQLGNGNNNNSNVPVQVIFTIQVAAAIPSSQAICSGQTTNIALTSNLPNTTFTWTVVQTNVTGAFASSGNSINQTLFATSTAPGTAVYTITPSSTGCIGPSITVTITVNPIPMAAAIPFSRTICNGVFTNIVLSSNVLGRTFNWTVVQNNVTGASPGSGNFINQQLFATTPNPGTAIYTVTPTANGCSGPPIIVTITVNPTAGATATATPSNLTICSGQTIHIALSSDIPGTTFSWTVVQDHVSGASPGSGNSIDQTLTSKTSGTAVYTITPFANGCEGNSINVTIRVQNCAPSHFRGRVRENTFATQKDIVHILTWDPSSNPLVVGYHLYQGHKLIKTIPAKGPFKVALHNRSDDLQYTYKLTSFTSDGVESTPLKVTLP